MGYHGLAEENQEGLDRVLSVVLRLLKLFSTYFFHVNRVSFGVFQSYYEAEYGPAPGRTGKTYSADDIAWIGSLQLAGLYGLAIPSAVVNDKLGPQVSASSRFKWILQEMESLKQCLSLSLYSLSS